MTTASSRVGALSAAMLLAGSSLLGCSPSFDKYDDSLRGTHELRRVIDFGQRIGPDGDSCWPGNRNTGASRLFCDLISIGEGGLHWNAGDVKYTPKMRANLVMGSGYLCVIDVWDVTHCWEWSQDVPPRPARVPQDIVFSRILGVHGDVCGEDPVSRYFACWTVGLDQPEYQQAVHRIRDDTRWTLHSNPDDSPHFSATQIGTGRSGYFDPYTGEQFDVPWWTTPTRVFDTERMP